MSKTSRRVRRAYREDQLARICTMPERTFGPAFGMQTTEVDQQPWDAGKDAPNDYYHFRDNGAHVLAVAHLDTVVTPKRRTPAFRDTKHGPRIVSGALDDRLGAYVILNLLPQLGATCDQLLTVGEESGQSTASFFESRKDYDWVIEFDRTGTDVVMYQYEDAASREAVEASGAKMGHGSFSDIAFLEQLGVKAFNWGVGYRGNYHSPQGYAYLNDTFGMVAKYLRFHAQNAGLAMPHTSYSRDDDCLATDDAGRFSCEFCEARYSVDPVTAICSICRTCQDCADVEDTCACYLPAALQREHAPAARVMTSERTYPVHTSMSN
jgi:acetylornithine deacetylase/succinyl-diaminopimelate desuccinylase-like protein